MQFLPGDFINFINQYFYLFVVIAIFQGALVLVLFILFLDKFLSSKPKRIKEEVIQQEAYKKAGEIFETSNKSALDKIHTAELKSQALINETKLFTDSFQKTLEANMSNLFTSYKAEFDKLSTDILTSYKQGLEGEKITTLASYNSVSDDIKKKAIEEIQSVSKDIRQTMVEAQGILRNEIEGDLKDLRGRLKDYEELRMRKVDERIFDILTMVSKEALGKLMTLSDHQDLVLKTLEDARSQNLF